MRKEGKTGKKREREIRLRKVQKRIWINKKKVPKRKPQKGNFKKRGKRNGVRQPSVLVRRVQSLISGNKNKPFLPP